MLSCRSTYPPTRLGCCKSATECWPREGRCISRMSTVTGGYQQRYFFCCLRSCFLYVVVLDVLTRGPGCLLTVDVPGVWWGGKGGFCCTYRYSLGRQQFSWARSTELQATTNFPVLPLLLPAPGSGYIQTMLLIVLALLAWWKELCCLYCPILFKSSPLTDLSDNLTDLSDNLTGADT